MKREITMKTQKTRLEEVEKKKPSENFHVVKQVLDVKSLTGEDLFKYEDEEKLMTLEEARERFKDGNLFYVTYSNKWRKHNNNSLDKL